MQQPVFAGIDIGHSAVKITMDGQHGVERVFFPSYVSPALNIIDDKEAERAAMETVSVGGRQYFVGDTARIQGGESVGSGLLDDWVSLDQHKALVAQACKIVRESAPDRPAYIVTGLPVNLFKTQKTEIKAQFNENVPPGSVVHVIPQPMAGFYHAVLMRDGMPNPNRSIVSDAYAVVDVGYYTSDFILIREGRWVQSAASSAPGVKLAINVVVDTLRAGGVDCDIQQAENVLATRKLKHLPVGKENVLSEAIDRGFHVLAEHIYDEFSRVMGKQAPSLDGIFVIGGVAQVIAERLAQSYPGVSVPEDEHRQPVPLTIMAKRDLRAPTLTGARFLVSEGFYRASRNLYLLNR